MLTKEEIAKNREEFIAIAKREIRSEGMYDVLKWLDLTDFYTAPASTRFHGSYEGGLCEHSLNVYNVLKDLNTLFGTRLKADSMALCALFHDVCKANFYKLVPRNVKDKDGKWTTKDVWEVDDKIPLGHGEKSVLLIQRFMTLELHEMLAIRWHMGGFDSAVKGGDYSLSKAQDMSPLVTLLHVADLISTNILEKKTDEN